MSDILCKSKKEFNEDAYIASGDIYVVIDGATDLGEPTKYNAHFFATQISNHLPKYLSDKDKHLSLCLSECIQYIKTTVPENFNRMSASIIILRKNGDKTEYLSLGDCTGVIKFNDGNIRVLHDNSVPMLDDIVVKLAISLSEELKITVSEAISHKICKDKLLEHRKLKNKQGGYYTCDLSGVGIEHAVYFEFLDVHSFLLMSDGYADIVHKFALYKDFGELIEAVDKLGVEPIANALFDAQAQDKDSQKFPRLKYSDDSTAVYEVF